MLNAMLLHKPMQNVLVFDILTDFTLFSLVCLTFYYKMCGTMTFYIKQRKFSLNFKVFILITIYLVFCPKNKTFVVMAQKFSTKRSYWIKYCESLGLLVHFILFIICITSL